MKITAFIFAIFFACFVAFSWGFTRGQSAALQHVYTEEKIASAEVALGQYTIYRDLAKNIKTNKIDEALCSVNLGASSALDEVKTCMTDAKCSSLLSKKVSEMAPEVMDKIPLPFEYLKIESGIRSCARSVK